MGVIIVKERPTTERKPMTLWHQSMNYPEALLLGIRNKTSLVTSTEWNYRLNDPILYKESMNKVFWADRLVFPLTGSRPDPMETMEIMDTRKRIIWRSNEAPGIYSLNYAAYNGVVPNQAITSIPLVRLPEPNSQNAYAIYAISVSKSNLTPQEKEALFVTLREKFGRE